jgi:hypothetical protein
MCVDNDSRPPITPTAEGSAGSRDFRLTSKRVQAFVTQHTKL